MNLKNIRNIIISRPDSIGDAVLALPAGKILKDYFPGVCIAYLGKAYTKQLIEACEYIDEFIDINDFLTKEITVCGQPPDVILHVLPTPAVARRAKQLKIPYRIATTNRWYHWLTCNKLVRLSRKNSDLHEAQLNLKLLSALGIKKTFSLTEIADSYGLHHIKPLQPQLFSLLNPGKYNIILHPKSQGNAIEWGIHNFISLIKLLDSADYNIFITGTEKEREYIKPLISEVGNKVTDLTGKMDLAQFISFINQCDGLIACSTGPVHLAAALGIDTYGLYSKHRPIHTGRWGPIGKHVFIIESEVKKYMGDMNDVQPETVKQVIDKNKNNNLRLHKS